MSCTSLGALGQNCLGIAAKYKEQKLSILRNTKLFVTFSDEQLFTLADYFRIVKLKSGDQVENGGYVVVGSGELAISTLVPNAPKKKETLTSSFKLRKSKDPPKICMKEVLCSKTPGACFGNPLREFWDGKQSKSSKLLSLTTVRALVPSTILVMDETQLNKFVLTCDPNASRLATVFSRDFISELNQLPFFKTALQAEKVALVNLFSHQVFEKNEVIFSKGDEADALYLIMEGAFDILISDYDSEVTHDIPESSEEYLACLGNPKDAQVASHRSLLASCTKQFRNIPRDLQEENVFSKQINNRQTFSDTGDSTDEEDVISYSMSLPAQVLLSECVSDGEVSVTDSGDVTLLPDSSTSIISPSLDPRMCERKPCPAKVYLGEQDIDVAEIQLSDNDVKLGELQLNGNDVKHGEEANVQLNGNDVKHGEVSEAQLNDKDVKHGEVPEVQLSDTEVKINKVQVSNKRNIQETPNQSGESDQIRLKTRTESVTVANNMTSHEEQTSNQSRSVINPHACDTTESEHEHNSAANGRHKVAVKSLGCNVDNDPNQVTCHTKVNSNIQSSQELYNNNINENTYESPERVCVSWYNAKLGKSKGEPEQFDKVRQYAADSRQQDSWESNARDEDVEDTIIRELTEFTEKALHRPSGCVHVVKRGKSNFVGEMALLFDMPRSATVVAAERTYAIKLKKEHFQNFLTLAPKVGEEFKTHINQKVVETLYSMEIPFMQYIPKHRLDELTRIIQIRQHVKGDVILEQGAKGSYFFIVFWGKLDVTTVAQGDLPVAQLLPGHYFGEISIVNHLGNTASVTVTTDKCVLLAIRDSDFIEFFSQSPEVIAEFEMKVLGEDTGLRQVLAHPIGKGLFHKFLASEYATESLRFYLAVEKLKECSTASQDEIQKLTKSIIQAHFVPSAPYPLNIPSDSHGKVLELYKNGDRGATIFSEPQQEIFKLIELDSFSRFKRSMGFCLLMEKIECYSFFDARKVVYATEHDPDCNKKLKRAKLSFNVAKRMNKRLGRVAKEAIHIRKTKSKNHKRM